jgi:hypothetical protein
MRTTTASRVTAGAALVLALPLALVLAPAQALPRTTPTDADGEPVPLSIAQSVPDDAGSLLPDSLTTTTGHLPQAGGSAGPSSDPDAESDTDGGTPAGPDMVGENVLRELGEVAGLADDAGNPMFEMVVQSIETTDSCPSRVDETFAPVNGRFLVVELTAAMADTAGGDRDDPENVFVPTAADFFRVLDADGTEQPGTLTEASWSCYTVDELISPSIVPGQTDSGYVVLDVSDEHGTLIYDPTGTDTGWAWEY